MEEKVKGQVALWGVTWWDEEVEYGRKEMVRGVLGENSEVQGMGIREVGKEGDAERRNKRRVRGKEGVMRKMGGMLKRGIREGQE